MLNYKLKIIALFSAIAIMAVGCNNSSISNNQTMSEADNTIQQLSEAFAHQDAAVIQQLISDGYDGFRYSESWTEEDWQNFSQAFKSAQFKSATDSVATYTIQLPQDESVETKDVQLIKDDSGKWLLEYRTFMVTPHGTN